MKILYTIHPSWVVMWSNNACPALCMCAGVKHLISCREYFYINGIARLRYSITILHRTLPFLINNNTGIIRFYSYLFLLSQARNLLHVLITSGMGHTPFLTSLLYLVTLKRYETLTRLSYQSCSFYSYSCWLSHNVRFMFVSRKFRKLLDTSISFYYLQLISTTFYYVLQGSICFYKEDLRCSMHFYFD